MIYADGEAISLLSHKYSIGEKTLIALIQEYNEYSIQFKIEQTNWLSESLGDDTLQEQMNLRPQFKVLDPVSEKYNIPKDKLAALLIDYKILSLDNEY